MTTLKQEFDADVLRERQVKLAMSSQVHLKQWLQASGRRWLVMDAMELVDALPWPGGVQELMGLVNLYTQHRRKFDSGRRQTMKDPVTGDDVETIIYKDEKLELAEVDRAIRYLVQQVLEWDPKWSLTNPAL